MRMNKENLKAFCMAEGATLFGVADITSLRKDFNLQYEVAEKFSRGISVAVKLSDGVLATIEEKPTPVYFHHYRQVNLLLDQLAVKLSLLIEDAGFLALPIPASQIIDWAKQLGQVSHKAVAAAAGLGWLGRNNLVVNPKLGARIRFVTILTDMPLPPADKPIPFSCAECKTCLKVCPAKAIKEKPGDFDHQACFGKLKEFKSEGSIGQYICGICVKACSGI